MKSEVASKQVRIEHLVELLEKGTTYTETLRIFKEKYGVCDSTVDGYTKIAKKLLAERNKTKEAIRQQTLSEDYKEAVTGLILSDIEIEAILCKIVTGDMSVQEMIQGTPTLRNITPTEIIQAAKTLYTKRGSNAPTKVAQTNPDGSKLDAAPVLNITVQAAAVDYVQKLSNEDNGTVQPDTQQS